KPMCRDSAIGTSAHEPLRRRCRTGMRFAEDGRFDLFRTHSMNTHSMNTLMQKVTPAAEGVMKKVAPSATSMIRMDHTHVLATFHRYRIDSPVNVKRGLVNTVCIALEVHAQLEEEIFYPAVRAISDNEAIRKSVPEHDE